MKNKYVVKCSAMTIILSLFMSVFYISPAQAAPTTTFGQPVDLGQMIISNSSVAIYDSVTGVEDGHNVLYTTVTGTPGQFAVINLDNYQVERMIPLEEGSDSWSMLVSNDYVYISTTGGRLHRYSIVTKEIENLGFVSPGQTALYGLTADEAGNIYGGTYPDAMVWKFDPVTGSFTDYQVSTTHQYVRSLAYYNGHLYAGTGAVGSIVKLNPDTGEMTTIAMPNDMVPGLPASLPFIYQLDVIDHYLFAHLSGGGTNALVVYDLVKQEWRSEKYLNNHGNRVYSPGNGKAYYKLNATGGLQLAEIDLTDFSVQTLAAAATQDFSNKGGGWVYFANNPSLPGPTLVSLTFDGRVGLYNIETNTYTQYPSILAGQPVPIQALEKGPDGKMYMSGYPGGSAAIYNPGTQERTVFSLGQAESIGFIGDKVIFNVYPKAQIYQLDTTKPIDTTNPSRLFGIEEEQDRPFVNITVGDTMYIGSVPDYGKLGGALTVYHSVYGSVYGSSSGGAANYEVYRNVVQDQSIVGLAHKDGLIYGSTSIAGGLDAAPTSSAAKMFIWDTATKQKVAEFVPSIPGAVKAPIMISGLTFGEDGNLWAAADGIIFAVNPDTQEVVKSKVIYPGVIDYGRWRPIHMRWGTDGLLYTDLYGQLTVLNPATMEHQSLGISTSLFELGDDGNIYYVQSTRLMMIPVTRSDDGGEPGEPLPTLNVFNGSFELDLVNGKIPGWTQMSSPSADTSYSVSTDQAFSGSSSLKMTDKATNESIWVASDPISILPGESYTASVKLYIDEGRTSFLFRFYDEAGNQIGTDAVSHHSTGLKSWQDVSLTAVAPAAAKSARVAASVSNLYMTTAYYDDFNLEGKFPQDTNLPVGTYKLNISPESVRHEEQVSVQVQAEAASELYAAEAYVSYDPTALAVEQVIVGDTFKAGKEVFFQYDIQTPGLIKLIASHTGDSSVSGNVDVVEVMFRAIGEGSSDVILLKSSKLAKADANDIGDVYSSDQDFSVSIQIIRDPTDVNGDSVINILDLIIVAKAIGGTYVDRYDMNGDGIVDIADLSLISLRMMN